MEVFPVEPCVQLALCFGQACGEFCQGFRPPRPLRLTPIPILDHHHLKGSTLIELGIPADIQQQVLAVFDLQQVFLERVDLAGEGLVGQERQVVESYFAGEQAQVERGGGRFMPGISP